MQDLVTVCNLPSKQSDLLKLGVGKIQGLDEVLVQQCIDFNLHKSLSPLPIHPSDTKAAYLNCKV